MAWVTDSYYDCFQTPFGQIHLHDARIEDVDNTNDSDDESEVPMTTKQVIAIWPPYQSPTYLIVPSKHEKVGILQWSQSGCGYK